KMYEDDGITLNYKDGAFRKTAIKVEGDTLKVEQTGTYEGMPEVRFMLV
nr:DUF5110 domain-containing protein [Clostridia bacterium]